MNRILTLILVLVSAATLTACNKKKASSVLEGLEYIYDDFDRADGSLGSDWSTYLGASGSLDISNGMVNMLSPGGSYLYALYQTPVTSSAFALTTTFRVIGGDLAATPRIVVLANMDAATVTSVSQYNLCGLDGHSYATINKSNNGTVATGTQTFDFTDGTDITITFSNDGANNLSCTVSDGTHLETLTYVDTNPEIGTYVGFGGWPNSGETYLYADDFTVTSLE